ncbi:MAG TPA: hypothetical protein VG758_05260, partial [Hyphomicrobiaceae bacterium]|nr:hypothetical protein [Hyphomicrobiaceae bacterium]
MRETEGASPEAHDQSCLRWFAASFLGWRTRSPDLRQRLIKSLSTDDFDQAYHAWINVEIGTEKVLADLRLERDTFMRELSAAGAVETSPSVFYDIAHDVEVWRLQPEWFQAREALR